MPLPLSTARSTMYGKKKPATKKPAAKKPGSKTKKVEKRVPPAFLKNMKKKKTK